MYNVPHVDDLVSAMQIYIGENYTMQYFTVIKGAKDQTVMKQAQTSIYFSSLKILSLLLSDSSLAPCLLMTATPGVFQMKHG